MRKKGTGTIYRRGRIYRAEITKNGKAKRKTFDTVEECEAFLKKLS